MKIISNKYQNKTSKEKNKTIPQEFVQPFSFLRETNLSLIINAAEVYKQERDNSNCYRISANLNLIASNVLFNITGDTSYETIIDLRNYDTEDDEFEFTEEEILLRENGWYYFLTGNTLSSCNKIYLEPNQDKFYFLNQQGIRNWNFYITYPERKSNTLSINGVQIKDGIRIHSMSSILFNNRNILKVFSSIEHGLQNNDTVKIKNLTTSSENIYTIYKIGDENNDYLENCFLIDTNITPIDANTNLLCFVKTINGIDSQYYKRDFKKITNSSDYNIYFNSFSNTIYSDKNHLITFEKDIDVTDLKDYLDRPISELYLSIIKSSFYNNNLYWSNVKSGIKSIFAFSDYDINTITTFQNIAINDNVNNGTDYYFGDIIEFNPLSQNEIILTKAYHRFNSISRDNIGYDEGYWYQPHYRFQIKQYDSEISETFFEEEAPEHASLVKGKYLWREQLDNSFVDNNDIPFMNGCHYLFNNVCVLLKRQDPCGEFELSSTVVSGDCISFDTIIDKEDDEIC